MTSPNHDRFAEAAAAYALGALDPGERQAFETHMASCVTCQREVAELTRVTAGIGLSVDPVAPPDPVRLKARVMASAVPPSSHALTGPRAGRRTSPAWLAAAAGFILAVSAGIYAWSQQNQLLDMRVLVAEISDRANELRNHLDELRRENARLSRVVDIVRGPSTLMVSLSATKDAPPASRGRAYFDPARGMVVSAEAMPGLRPGRAYQLWVVPDQQKPIGAGVFTVSDTGAATFEAIVPANLPAGTLITVAITDEPAGGSPQPTTAILVAGRMVR